MIKVENLSCGYTNELVLDNVSLNVAPGEMVGVIGPNGSGKTTLIKAITGLVKLKSGSVLIDGDNINSVKSYDKAKKIAVVSQQSEELYLTVEEYVLLGRIPYYGRFQLFETKEDRSLARKYIEMMGITQYIDHPLNQMSGGERQLAVIARALTQEPKALLLDEPTSYLDITHQAKVLDLVKKLNKKLGLSVLIVLHDLNLASEYCDRLVLLNQKKVHKAGTPDEVLRYDIIEEVYKTVVVVRNNPITNKPYIFIVPEERLHTNV